MPLISVTRLRVRSPRYLPAFMWASLTSARQARRAPGFLGGQLAAEPGRSFWTLTAWTDLAAMRAYRGSGAHRRAMSGLRRWCDEASVAHWDQADAALPSGPEALARMVGDGRVSPVDHPSSDHAAATIAPARRAPRPGLHLRARGPSS